MTESEQQRNLLLIGKEKDMKKGKASRFGCLCYEMYSGWSILNSL